MRTAGHRSAETGQHAGRGQYAVLNAEHDLPNIGEVLESAPLFFRLEDGQGTFVSRDWYAGYSYVAVAFDEENNLKLKFLIGRAEFATWLPIRGAQPPGSKRPHNS